VKNRYATRLFLIFSFLFLLTGFLFAQKPETQLNGFGHVQFGYDHDDKDQANFSIGEHDFFVTSKLRKNISFLGEYVFRFGTNSFIPSIERSLVKFNYKGNHSLIAGKIHTPVNYWNDVYHHGRLFFPTIDRPLSFSYLIPLHTLGIQMQGQNLGNINWGYDVVIGNGISSTDISQQDNQFSITAAMHMKPIDNLRIGISYYKDYLPTNQAGSHSGHNMNPSHYTGTLYKGAVDFHLGCLSLAYFGNKFEFLGEASYNATITDSLGRADNYSGFMYSGVRIADQHVPYVIADYLKIANNDLYSYPLGLLKVGVGYKYEFNHLLNVKAQIEYLMQEHNHSGHTMHDKLSVKVQLAYGF
jgi:hypothetical protein